MGGVNFLSQDSLAKPSRARTRLGREQLLWCVGVLVQGISAWFPIEKVTYPKKTEIDRDYNV